MYPNINTGLGQLMATALVDQGYVDTTGRFYIVGKASLASLQEVAGMYPANYPDGTPMVYNTLALASAACVASRGDIIFVMPGHTETISSSTAVTLSVAGITVIGLGKGSLRPTFTLDTVATSRINVTGSNITIANCLFIANFADIATVFLNNAGPSFEVLNCEFRDTSSILNFLAIVTTTVSVNADGLKFNGNRLKILGITAATTPIKILGTMDRLTINDNYVTKAVLNNTSCLLAHGALVVTNLEMARNRIFSANTDSATGGFLITTSATTNSGMVYDNYVQGLDVAAAILVTAGCNYGMFNNLYDGDADKSGFVLPAIGTD